MEWAERIGRRIKLRELHVVLAVAQTGSIGKAAKQLAVTHPVVSRVLTDLEGALGVRLFDRDRHGAIPTIFGQALLGHAVAAFDELRQGVRAIEFLSDPTGGELWLGANDPMLGGLVPAIIDRMLGSHPQLTFHVTQAPVLQQLQEIRERRIELSVGRLPLSMGAKDLDISVLFDESILVTASLQHPLARRRRIKLAEVVHRRWILPEVDTLIGSVVANVFHASGLDIPRRAVFCNSVHMNNAMLMTGSYLAIYPRSYLHFSGERLPIKALPVDLPIRSTPVGIATLKGRTISPIARLFIEQANEVTKPLRPL